MPKKPNYRFDRLERERHKAAKKADRLAAKQGKANERKKDDEKSESSSSDENEPGIRERQ